MSKKLRVILFLLIVPWFSVPTLADSYTNYTINFTTVYGSPSPTSGAFTYDSTSPKFSNFLVEWDGLTFDLTYDANHPEVTTCCPNTGPSVGTATDTFDMLTLDLPGEPANAPAWLGNGSSFSIYVDYTSPSSGMSVTVGNYEPIQTSADYADGTWTISPVSSPVQEPSTLYMLLSGLLGFGVIGAVKRPRQDFRASQL